jgi:hypothetical protein
MTKEEYLDFLESIGKEYLRLESPHRIFHPMKDDSVWFLNKIQTVARTLRFAEEHSEHYEIYRILKKEIEAYHMEKVQNLLEETGVLDALDEYGDIIYPNLIRDAIPDEDILILKNSGEKNPDALIQLALVRSKKMEKSSKNYDLKRPIASKIIDNACAIIEKAEKDIKDLSDKFNKRVVIEETCDDWKERNKKMEELDEELAIKPKKKSWIGGIARIIAGGASATGNVLLGAGLIPTGGGTPVGTAAIIGSCASALVLIGDGIEKVRGVD